MHASSLIDLQPLGLTSFQKNMLRIFGSLTYVHVQSGERSKLDSKLRKCICLGSESIVKAIGFGIQSQKRRSLAETWYLMRSIC